MACKMKTISGLLEENSQGFVLRQGKGKAIKLLINTSDLKSQIELHIAKCNQTKIDVCGVFEDEGFCVEEIKCSP